MVENLSEGPIQSCAYRGNLVVSRIYGSRQIGRTPAMTERQTQMTELLDKRAALTARLAEIEDELAPTNSDATKLIAAT